MKTPITTIIVDDESNSIAKLSNDLANYPEIKVIETTTSVEKAKKNYCATSAGSTFFRHRNA